MEDHAGIEELRALSPCEKQGRVEEPESQTAQSRALSELRHPMLQEAQALGGGVGFGSIAHVLACLGRPSRSVQGEVVRPGDPDGEPQSYTGPCRGALLLTLAARPLRESSALPGPWAQ